MNLGSTSTSDRSLSGLALQVLDYEKRLLGGEVFEYFNRDFIALRLALEKHFGANVTSLSDLYKGAWVGDGARNTMVVVDCDAVGTTSTLPNRFPSTRQDLQIGKVYKNAQGAPYDLVCLLPQAEGGTLVVAYECKHTRMPSSEGPTVNVTMINEAMTKVLGAGGGNTSPVVLVFISNRLYSDKDKASTTDDLSAALQVGGSLSHAIIVVRQNCVEYFGPSLARRFKVCVEPEESGVI